MMRSASFPLTVTRRNDGVLIPPAKPTPHDLKPLSDIDDRYYLRIYVPHIQIYRRGPRGGKDPVRVIREALAEALVYYYPFAGRLREGIGRKLWVDCTGEGVLFVEADAGFTLEDLCEEDGLLCPPFRNARNLFPDDVPVSAGVLNLPLLFFQVTRLKCGGTVVAISINHTMTDAAGLVQFMNAMAQLARGASHPSVVPVWRRELLESRNRELPPTSTADNHEYHNLEGFPFPLNYTNDPLTQRSFFFGSTAISALHRQLPPQMTRTTTFELLAAFLWRCRTIALRFDPDEELQFLCAVNIHQLLKSPQLPASYYGNTFVLPEAVSTARELCRNALHYAVELIKKAKAEVTEEYVRSLTGHLQAIRGEPRHVFPAGGWLPSDNTRAGFHEIDFGWGKPVFGGPCSPMVGVLGSTGFFVRGRDGKGEIGVILLICLPETAMERFAVEVECGVGIVGDDDSDVISKL